MYHTSTGKSGVQKLRLQPAYSNEAPHLLAFKLEQLTEGAESSCVLSSNTGITITAARMLEMEGLLFTPFRYAVIYESDNPDIYAVFYVSRSGEVTWIAGPKKITFEKVWSEFNQALKQAAA